LIIILQFNPLYSLDSLGWTGGGLDELVVQLPGESVFALAANAWMKYDYVMKMREKEHHGTDRKK
jgi:hypothetical protein